jgi:addiction module RelE/StbE family toxin
MKVVWTRIALSQLDEIQDYIAQDSPAAAYKLAFDIVDRTERQLSTSPESGRLGRVRGTRELVFPNQPYIVAYRVRQQVEVLAVVHSAREWPEEF